MKYSNPRREAIIDDWPYGRFTCRAWFVVQTKPGKGERVARMTENKTRTGWNKPKVLTYSHRVMIVDGDDGRTYILRDCCGFIDVACGDMKFTHESLWPKDDGYGEALALLAATCKPEEVKQ